LSSYRYLNHLECLPFALALLTYKGIRVCFCYTKRFKPEKHTPYLEELREKEEQPDFDCLK
jgi:hypothetical protein